MTSIATPAASHTIDDRAAGVRVPLLIATSGRDGTAALRAAALFASKRKAEVAVLSVIEPDPASAENPWLLSPAYEARCIVIRRAVIRQQLQDVQNTDTEWPIEVRFGSPADEIASEARRRKAGLIIMDSGRHDVIARLLAGEVTLRTIRYAGTPVLAVGPDLRGLPRVAVAAIDFSPSSIAAARAALDVLSDRATLYLVHVWPRSSGDDPVAQARDEAYERRLLALFRRVEGHLHPRPGITIHPVSRRGAPVDELLQFAASQRADLIVAGRRGHGFFERLLVGIGNARASARRGR
jgi:nucleotide-binding universal stress UspA family protein